MELSGESSMDVELLSDEEARQDCYCGESDKEKKLISPELLQALLDGAICLPESHLFPLPPEIKCPGGCLDNVFCSNSCAGEAWDSYHTLLCTGEGLLCRDRSSLTKFKEHAAETNERPSAKKLSSLRI